MLKVVAIIMANAITISKGNSGIVGVGFRLGVELVLGDKVGVGVGESVGLMVVVGVGEGDGVDDEDEAAAS